MPRTLLLVLDTNVVVSALRSSIGASFKLLGLLREGKIRVAVTGPLVFEYQDVLLRPGLIPHLSSQEKTAFVDWFVSVADCHEVHYLWRPTLHDPNDDMVLEAALASSADCLVTHNVTDFAEAAKLGISVLTPANLLQNLRQNRMP